MMSQPQTTSYRFELGILRTESTGASGTLFLNSALIWSSMGPASAGSMAVARRVARTARRSFMGSLPGTGLWHRPRLAIRAAQGYELSHCPACQRVLCPFLG